MKIVRTLSRIIVGMVFVFSGFVKAVDPLGSTYKFSDYFNAFGMGYFVDLALPLALILSSLELVLGISLLFGYRIKSVSWVLLVFMSFFTVLTFILAIYNPVTDCGCFGDALIITNWQTFWKNIVLMIFTLVIFTGRNKFPSIRGAFAEWGILIFFFAGAVSLSVYCKNHLPLVDFRPYKIGTNIPAATSIPEDAPADEYETRLFYKNTADGKTSEFTIDNFPEDSAWEFVDSKSVLISKGYETPIHDFSIAAPNGEDITETIKNAKGFTFLLISNNLPKADKNALKKANDYFRLSGVYGDLQFFAVTASLDADIQQNRDSLELDYDFGSADEIALKTMIRSNPGLLLIKDGTIIGKWHYNDFPESNELGEEFTRVIKDFPVAEGINLRNLKIPPDGSRSDVYETSLLYRNNSNDSVSSFTMNNFPQDDNWSFVSSNSRKIKSGYISPVEKLKLTTAEGNEISDRILQEQGDLFLVFAKEPHNLDPDILERLNKLSVLGASYSEGPVFFYALTGLTSQQLYGFTDSFISPVTFCSSPADFVEDISGKGVSLVHIKNGVVLGRWNNTDIPGPEKFADIMMESRPGLEFESSIIPYVIGNFRSSVEQKRVYILIFGFLFLSLFIRVFLEDPFNKH